nr:MAG TPA: hypothetical protein [Caudoviricetes sp.]
MCASSHNVQKSLALVQPRAYDYATPLYRGAKTPAVAIDCRRFCCPILVVA